MGGVGGVPNPNNDFQVANPPGDGISSLSWSPTSNFLVATSWDCDVLCYEVGNNGQAMPKASIKHEARRPAPNQPLFLIFSTRGASSSSNRTLTCFRCFEPRHVDSRGERVMFITGWGRRDETENRTNQAAVWLMRT